MSAIGVSFETVYERDIDLLIMNSFCNNSIACKRFFACTQLSGAVVKRIIHSFKELDGESDIIIEMQNNDGNLHWLMIEDKVDAVSQTEQYERYIKRGNRAVQLGKTAGYTVFIVAPNAYLQTNAMAKKYPNRISYEELLQDFNEEHNIYACALLQRAIEKENNPEIVDEAVTAFWKDFISFQKEVAPDLNPNVNKTTRGTNSVWVNYITQHRGVRLTHKANQGRVDLSFKDCAIQIMDLAKSASNYTDSDMHWHTTGKSASIGIDVPFMDFTRPFSFYKDDMLIVFDAVTRLLTLLDKIFDEGLFGKKAN